MSSGVSSRASTKNRTSWKAMLMYRETSEKTRDRRTEAKCAYPDCEAEVGDARSYRTGRQYPLLAVDCVIGKRSTPQKMHIKGKVLATNCKHSKDNRYDRHTHASAESAHVHHSWHA